MKNKASKQIEKNHFNENRDTYLDKDGNYVYTQWKKQANGHWKRVVTDIIPLTAENKDIILMLGEDDHSFDLQERYEKENLDYGFVNLQNNRHGSSDDEDYFLEEPIDGIADPKGNAFDMLYPEEKPKDPRVCQVEDFINDELSSEQRDMVYDHLGSDMYIDDMRLELEAKKGVSLTKQGYNARWNKIITLGCENFGVEKPKQEHRKAKKS